MTREERKLLDRLSKMELPEYEKELKIILEIYDFDSCNEDFENDDTPFEESLEKWLNSLSEEDKEAFLNEDWSEFGEI